MPLYEYECEKCGDVFEIIQRFSDAPLEVHEKCGGPVHRLVSAPAFQFKGSGWYVTDYAKGKNSGDSPDSAAKKTDTSSKPASSGASEGTATPGSGANGGGSSDKK